MEDSLDPKIVSRRRRQLVMLALLFMAPVIAAWVAWKFVGTHGFATQNAGRLITPAKPLSGADIAVAGAAERGTDFLHGRWTYVIFEPESGCSDECERQLFFTRQIRVSVNKDMHRIQRVMVLRDAPSADRRENLLREHTDLLLVIEGTGDTPVFSNQFDGEGLDASGKYFFLVDPLGNLMMSYDLTIEPKGILKDLRKLLKISQIG